MTIQQIKTTVVDQSVPLPNSSTGEVVDFALEKVNLGIINSALLSSKPQMQTEILDLLKTRKTEGWDGYDAKPLNDLSKDSAALLIDALPLESLPPMIVPTSGGGFSFEWKSRSKYLVIEIEGKELSAVFIDSAKRLKKSLYIETFLGEQTDACGWVIEEFGRHGKK